ncbi:hypothetical protein EQG49_11255 [Periweissella cryptocerci]|uniref:Uncharacterized protein n=1 Tax=Periweissella cryptocerci TaxID=2506420 RepID=A0A4P6YVY8_9LACO|nr:hypothetical protein [Periweissella cryptocerci]QBO36984.1 hypothetical protein EQG49_11255 [Periweissella cryptocerci]
MDATKTITPSKSISNCRNGWILHWQGYDGTNLKNSDHHYQYVPKTHVLKYSGQGIQFDYMAGINATTFGMKYCYFSDTTITGNDGNASSAANKWLVLAEVIEY